MRILIEEHSYQATEDILNVVSELGPTIGVGGKVSIGYVGYYYNTNIQDCVFILPKVLLDEQGRAFQKYNPEDIIHLENRNNPLNEEERHFVYELSVWIYRAICVFKERNKDTQIVLHERVAQIGHGQHRMSNTFLDILLSLIQFYQDNQDFFFFTIKNLHSGHNKINWTKTIAHSQAYMQGNSPVYLNPTNKRRQVNFDEELMVIYFSILNYIHHEYGFPFETECHYDTISNQQFATYLKGMGKTRLQQIRYKYFSDKALELWNLCFAFFDDNRRAEQKVELQAGTGMLRDETTEGYNIIPNFFISAQQRDLEMHSDITWVDRENKDFTSRQFRNRLFDRDTLLVCHYDVNFLYVVALYGRKNEGMKAAWREKVRAQFRKEIQSMLDNHFQFHIMTPRKFVNGEEVLRQNFKQVLGKVFKPYPNAPNEQCFYSLALEKPETIKDEKQRAATIEENQNIKQLLGEHFEILECKIGEDRRNELKTPTPDTQCGISNKDLVLLITKEGVHFDKNIQLLETTKRIGIALKMDGAVLQLVEGFTKASILIIHNKSNKHRAYRLAEKGPRLVPASGAPEMVVTKQGEDLYLVYDVDLTEGQPPLELGELDLKPITKGGDSYSPHLLPLSSLLT